MSISGSKAHCASLRENNMCGLLLRFPVLFTLPNKKTNKCDYVNSTQHPNQISGMGMDGLPFSSPAIHCLQSRLSQYKSDF